MWSEVRPFAPAARSEPQISEYPETEGSVDYRRRVVITGLGVVAPNGIGKDAFWQALVAGKSAARSRISVRNRL
ncbi:MAG: hypothetical protein DMD72_13830 [Gemmatimonadetes bacterium]|nr:MAG: hypothetical protein DMD72_13830 [Gemmatimonadota bacterium]